MPAIGTEEAGRQLAGFMKSLTALVHSTLSVLAGLEPAPDPLTLPNGVGVALADGARDAGRRAPRLDPEAHQAGRIPHRRWRMEIRNRFERRRSIGRGAWSG